MRALIVALLSAGGATFVWTVFKSIIAWRNSAEGREDRAVGRLEKFEADCREQLREEREWGRYWHRAAGVYLYAITVHGVPEPSLPPCPRDPDDPGDPE